MQKLFVLLSLCISLSSKAQDVDGVWIGNFIQYIHNTYDVEMVVVCALPTVFILANTILAVISATNVI